MDIAGHGAATVEIENDWVLAMTGYQPDFPFLESLGVTFAADEFRTPVFDEATFETARRGMYIAGTVCGGYRTNRWFIENGRFHAEQIAKHIAGERTDPIRFEAMHWKTEE
jgi:thioredoxin reductase (NADPH)